MFRLTIVTPEKVAFDAEIRGLIVPGVDGYLGILSQHAPLISALKPGKIEITDVADKVYLAAVSAGFLEVSSNVATLLADAVELADEIDIGRAKKALDRAKSELAALYRGDPIDATAAEVRLAMERAHNRITVYEKAH